MIAPGAGRRPAAVAPATSTGRGRCSSSTACHPVFHVADQTAAVRRRLVHRPGPAVRARRSSRCSSGRPPRCRCTDLIVNGVFERHPDLRLGIVELSAVWLPMFLLMLDGGVDFTTKLNGRAAGRAVAAAERVHLPPGPGVVVLLRAARRA